MREGEGGEQPWWGVGGGRQARYGGSVQTVVAAANMSYPAYQPKKRHTAPGEYATKRNK